ncbi:MAG TPA: cupin domain-containing protein [Gemmatimonadales bacterium]
MLEPGPARGSNRVPLWFAQSRTRRRTSSWTGRVRGSFASGARLYYRTLYTRGDRVADVPYRVDKPWGYELIWARTDRYVGKVLHVRAGHILSLQYHNRKDETMHVFRGELILRTGPADRLEERPLRAGESVHIPPGLVHQIEAVEDSDVLEASTPELDDLVRLQDRYGRG